MGYETNKRLFYILNFALSNKYIQVIIQSVQPKIFDAIVDILYDFVLFYRIKPQLYH